MTDWPLVAPADPRVDYRPSERAWVAREAFTVRDPGSGKRVDIPKEFHCDGASIPRILWWYIAPHELGRCAAVVHDRLYRALRRHLTRAQADRLFLLLMLWEGVDAEQAVDAYLAVRRFGWWSWWINGIKARRAHRRAMRQVRA